MADARFGLTLPLDAPLAEHPRIAGELAAAGYTDFWSSEVDGYDAVTPLALAAAGAPGANLGTAIVSAYTRGPATLAMTAATLAELAPGRFQLGLGTASPPIVRQWNGIAFDRPFHRVRDTLRFLRQALAGERVARAYDTFTVDGFRLTAPPRVVPPVLLAALGPQMLRLAGAEADGAILNWLSAADVEQVVGHVRDGGDAKEIVARIFVSPFEDADLARANFRRMVTSYLNVPAYAAYQRGLGRGGILAPMWSAWEAGDRKGALAAIPDELVDDLLIHGTPEHCRRRISDYVDNGVTVPVVMILDPRPDADPVQAALSLAPGTAPAGHGAEHKG